MFTTNNRLLVACSGGVDSMVLCHLLHVNGFNFCMAHCNFQLRAEESNADEALVKSYAASNNIALFTAHFDTQAYITTHKKSVQLAARELRYEWFDRLIEAHGFDYLLTAHHADDNVETVLMNLFKGTGINGMKGIATKQDKLVRPLLFATKQALVAYAIAQKVPWREDASNAGNKYTRNYFRNVLIPQVEKVIPNAAANVNSTIGHFAEAAVLYQQAVEIHKRHLLHYKNEEVHIPVLKLAAVTPFNTVVFELLKPFGFAPGIITHVQQLLKADTGKYISSNTHRIIKNRKWLVIVPVAAVNVANVAIDEADNKVVFEQGSITITSTNNTDVIKDPMAAMLDAKMLSYPLLLRKWKQGDYFYPLGMQKKKKVARFMIDQKLSQHQKENTWVLISNSKIVWVVGYRIDNRFKVTANTKEVRKIRFTPN